MTPDFTENQKAMMELIAESAAEKTIAKLNLTEMVNERVQAHEDKCGLKKRVQQVQWMLIGFMSAFVLSQGGSIVEAMRFLIAHV